MNLSPQAQAILLLTTSFGKNDSSLAKPLSKGEWKKFSKWLYDQNYNPSDLITKNIKTYLSTLLDKKISSDRIQSLLQRGTTLGLALEKWERAGLWVMIKSDPDYPKRLKEQLGPDSPAVLFGSGNKNILNKKGIAVIGSRHASDDDLKFTQKIGKDTASEGYSIVSGGARGVDQCAMSGALDNEGIAIGVLADSLLRESLSARYRTKIMSGDLVLISPFNPEAGFNVGTAMARNRYIHCLSDAAIVVSSTAEKGGTWSGAIENLKAGWVPLWVKKTENTKSGNSVLVNKGANWLPNDSLSVELLIGEGELSRQEPTGLLQLDLKQIQPKPEDVREATNPTEINLSGSNFSEGLTQTIPLYEAFILNFKELTNDNPLNADEISLKLQLEKSQTNTWLKQGVSEGIIRKLMRPVRYQGEDQTPKQGSLLI